MTSALPGMPTTAVPPAAAAVSLSASGGNGRDCSGSHPPLFRKEIQVSGLKIGILDDYQVALSLADWSSLDANIEVFTAPFADADEVVKRLADFDVLVAMRERTRFPADVLFRLRSLTLLVSTGPINSAIDVKAARELGIVVCGTGYFSYPAAELTWALVLAASRNLPSQVQSMRTGGWQLGLGTSVRGQTLGLLGLGNVASRSPSSLTPSVCVSSPGARI